MSELFVTLCIVERRTFSHTNFFTIYFLFYFIFNCILFYDYCAWHLLIKKCDDDDDDDGHGSDWIELGEMTDCDPVLISNHCSTVDAVSYKL